MPEMDDPRITTGPMPPPPVAEPPAPGFSPIATPEQAGFSVADLQLEDMVPPELLQQLTSEATAQMSPWEAVSLGLLAVSDPDLAMSLHQEKVQGKQVARQTILGLRSQIAGFNKAKLAQESQFERARQDAMAQEGRRVLQDRSDTVDKLTQYASEAGVAIPPPPPDLTNDAQFTAWYRAVQPQVAERQRKAQITEGLVKEVGTLVDKGADAEGMLQYLTGRARQLGIKDEEMPGFLEEMSAVVGPMAQVAEDKRNMALAVQQARIDEMQSLAAYRDSLMQQHIKARDAQDENGMRLAYSAVTSALARATEAINQAQVRYQYALASGNDEALAVAQQELSNRQAELIHYQNMQRQMESDLDAFMTARRLTDPGNEFAAAFNEVLGMGLFDPEVIVPLLSSEPNSQEAQMFVSAVKQRFLPPTLTPAERERRERYFMMLEIKNIAMPFQPLPAGGVMQPQQPQSQPSAPPRGQQ